MDCAKGDQATTRRYDAAAYAFVMEAAERAIGERRGTVTGNELLDTIRDVAVERFGPMAKSVFEHWGVTETRDFGRVVYDLIDAGLLGENEGDSIEDFGDVYEFGQAFETDYFER
ncbi:MAG: hypothetical protein JW876_03540 [Candidatus Krumholzibacteriota bacterium]|nr:hypothetical protein [Candidatus Krumholzibacteriota bacterium]